MKPTPYGMTAPMWQAYNAACTEAGIAPPKFPALPRITQTLGNAPASAGFHARDGDYEGHPYCAAIDISVRGFTDPLKRQSQIKWFLFHLALHGYVAWFRHTGSFKTNQHIHAVYVGHRMKPELQAQVRDFLNNRTGLVGHARETFWTASPDVDNHLRAIFLNSNPQ